MNLAVSHSATEKSVRYDSDWDLSEVAEMRIHLHTHT